MQNSFKDLFLSLFHYLFFFFSFSFFSPLFLLSSFYILYIFAIQSFTSSFSIFSLSLCLVFLFCFFLILFSSLCFFSFCLFLVSSLPFYLFIFLVLFLFMKLFFSFSFFLSFLSFSFSFFWLHLYFKPLSLPVSLSFIFAPTYESSWSSISLYTSYSLSFASFFFFFGQSFSFNSFYLSLLLIATHYSCSLFLFVTKNAKFGVVLRAIKIKAGKDENKYVNALLVMEKEKVEKRKKMSQMLVINLFMACFFVFWKNMLTK